MFAIYFVGAILAASPPAPAVAATTLCDAQWKDPARSSRQVPVRIRIPAGRGKVPLILFSHGLGGSLDGGTAWVERWAAAGFAVINLQHSGSDREAVAKGRLVRAMSFEQLSARAADVRFVIDRVERKGLEGACDLGRIDLRRIGMSGHSFGAHTTLAISGQKFGSASLVDRRVDAAIAFSPAPPRQGGAEQAFANVRIPFFSITGTADKVPFLPRITPEQRQIPFASMPPGGKYLLVLAGGDHADMGGRSEARRGRAGEKTRMEPRMKETIASATSDFWRWSLLGDAAAKARLDALPRRLRTGDSFKMK